MIQRTTVSRRRRIRSRRGALLILMGLLMVSLVGMLGLVIDTGMMMSQARQAQNIADAAALAAARDLLGGRNAADAQGTATDYIAIHNPLTPATTSVIQIPPTTGPYAGKQGFVEVSLSQTVNTFFIHAVPGIASSQTVTARAVAGYESHSAGEGVAVLDPTARPGLDVSGQARLRVNGRVVVNSEGGGEDENGIAVANGNTGTAASGGQPNSDNGIYALDIRVVGGVDKYQNFKNYVSGGSNPLKAKQLPEPDPLINLPVPTVALGIDSRSRGSVSVTNNSVQGLNTDTTGQNRQATAGESIAGGLHTAIANEVILHPGIYNKIDITGGTVYFIPGIYVITAQFNNQAALKITGGTIVAHGVMFYNTGDNFEAASGSPDINDGGQAPPISDGAKLGSVAINAGLTFSPLKTSSYAYGTLYDGAQAVSNQFDGMLFFQRRRNTETISISGNAADGTLEGTLYAKWARFQVTGQGTYDAQFVAGSLSVTGQGDITILSAGGGLGRANEVYLVE
jgi:Flp pilus assembly protein TadG